MLPRTLPIFAMLAIKGFRIIPSAATPQRIDGVCALIRKFTPWHDEDPDPKVDPPPFSDATAGDGSGEEVPISVTRQ